MPILCDPSFPVRICAALSIPRVGFSVLLERPDASVLFGALAGCSATLDVTSRCSFAIEAAEIGVRAGHGRTPATVSHTRGTHLLHSPCLSFAQLQHSYHPRSSQDGEADVHSSMQPQKFLHGTITPCGAGGGDTDPEPPHAPFDTAQPPFNVHAAPHGVHVSNVSVRSSSHAGEDREYVPSPSGSAASHDVPAMHEEMRWSQRHRQVRATELLKERMQKLRGDILLGSVSVTIAPLEAFIDSAALVRVLELGMQLCSEVQQGDAFLQQYAAVPCTCVWALDHQRRGITCTHTRTHAHTHTHTHLQRPGSVGGVMAHEACSAQAVSAVQGLRVRQHSNGGARGRQAAWPGAYQPSAAQDCHPGAFASAAAHALR